MSLLYLVFFLTVGPTWKLHRTLISKCFTNENLNDYSKTIAEKGVSLLNRWGTLGARTDGVDVQGDLSRCALDIIGSIAFGIEMDATNAPESKWATAADIILKETALQTMQPVGNQETPLPTKNVAREGRRHPRPWPLDGSSVPLSLSADGRTSDDVIAFKGQGS